LVLIILFLLANVIFRASGNVKVSQATEKIKGLFSLEIFGLQSVPHTILFTKKKLARKIESKHRPPGIKKRTAELNARKTIQQSNLQFAELSTAHVCSAQLGTPLSPYRIFFHLPGTADVNTHFSHCMHAIRFGIHALTKVQS